MKRLLILTIFFKIFTGVQAVSEEYPNWKGFPPMYTINDIIDYKGCVYCTTIGGIFRYEPLTQEYSLYYKNQGLVSNDVLCIAATPDEILLDSKRTAYGGLTRITKNSGRYFSLNIMLKPRQIRTALQLMTSL